jgi:carbonic anhydrase
MKPLRTLAVASLMTVALGPAAGFAGASAPASSAAAEPALPAPAAVLEELKAGNQREVSGTYAHPHENAAWRSGLASGQHPHAVILGCADSRVPPELVFDQGLGDLFDVRVAGNIADDAVIASIEYAVEHLHTPLVVVMGHQKCGAVTAAAAGGRPEGHLAALVNPILPAVEKAAKLPGDRIENAVRLNVENVVAQLRASQPVLAERVASGKLQIVGAVYSLDTGKVSWLSTASSGGK